MYRFIKRAIDIFCSFLALAVTSPLWLFLAVGIKLSSPGPVFYRSLRAGKDRKEFTVLKFRSMHVYVPDDPNSGKKAEGGFVANEQRIFRLGSFLRKSKLDELPQLLSIFVGKMSVVGPRPYPLKSVEKFYSGEYACVMSVKPGLTGLDSLYDYAHGELFVKDNETYKQQVLPVRTELSRMYVQRYGFLLDAYCVLRTVRLMFEIVVLRKRTFPLTKYEAAAAAAVRAQEK